MYALGSDSGVVNLYTSSQLSNALSHRSSVASLGAAARLSAASSAPAPTPVKALMHLTTPVDYLRFNHDSSLLLMASRRKKDALKLVHTASASVFANWPTSSTPLHYVSSVDFSPNSGYMAIGNDRGRVLLYRLTHFPRA
jgi:U3 small nucleolar RNA-associated protein 18